MDYACLNHQQFVSKEGYSLVPVREQDVENIRIWRNAQINVLRQKTPLTPQQQTQYFQEKIFPSFSQKQPPQILFSLLKDNECIGYGGLVHIDWESKRGEVSFLLDPKYSSSLAKIFSSFLQLLFTVAFEHLKFHRIFAETYALRAELIPLFEKEGFVIEGRMREHVYKAGEWHDSIILGILAKDRSA